MEKELSEEKEPSLEERVKELEEKVSTLEQFMNQAYYQLGQLQAQTPEAYINRAKNTLSEPYRFFSSRKPKDRRTF